MTPYNNQAKPETSSGERKMKAIKTRKIGMKSLNFKAIPNEKSIVKPEMDNVTSKRKWQEEKEEEECEESRCASLRFEQRETRYTNTK